MKANKYQDLLIHSNKISEFSKLILEHLNIDSELIILDSLYKISHYAALFHDIGKLDPNFQNFINNNNIISEQNGTHIKEDKKFSFQNYPRHNEISYFIVSELIKFKDLNKQQTNVLKNVILWHHASPIRKEDMNFSKIISAIKSNKEQFKNNLIQFHSQINDTNIEINFDDFDDIFESNNNNLDNYKKKFSEEGDKTIEDIKNDIKIEAITSLLRTVLITADRIVSHQEYSILNANIIDKMFNENILKKENLFLLDSIKKMKTNFFPESERSILQNKAITELKEKNNNIDILSAPAGSGKTKTSLEWCLSNKSKKVYFIVPRTIIAEELYKECKDKYLSQGVHLQIITGEKKQSYLNKKEQEINDTDIFKGDIIFTTIDQIVKSLTTHKSVCILLDLLMSDLIFDEFHEYSKMSAFDLLFAELITLKKHISISKTLLMTATPNYFFIEKLININKKDIVEFETTNKEDYLIKFTYYNESEVDNFALFYNDNSLLKINNFKDNTLNKNPIYKNFKDDKKSIIISNTATTAQRSFILNYGKEKSILAHSKFIKENKINTLNKIKESFEKNEYKKENILRAGPIVQASLNITSERLVTEICSAENTLQRLGRLNRYGEKYIGEFIIAVPEQVNFINKDISNIQKEDFIFPHSNVFKVLNNNNSKYTTYLWYLFLKSKIKFNEHNEAIVKLKDLYSIYKDFYDNNYIKYFLEEELLKSLKDSYKNIRNNVIDPVEIIGKHKKNNKENEKLSKYSLRNSSFFCNLANYKLIQDSLNITDNYSNLNIQRKDILLYNENFDLVSISKKSIKYIEDINKKDINKLNDKQYLDLARDKENSIYLSFSGKDLLKLNKEQSDLSYIYLTTENSEQDIGYIQIKKLTKGEINE